MRILIVLLLFLFTLPGWGQEVLLSDGSKLSGIQVVRGQMRTNEAQLTVLDSTGQKITIPAADIEEYYWRGRIYYSTIPEGETEKRIIRYLVFGPVSLAESFDKYLNKTFYLSKEGKVFNLESVKFEIDVYMLELMDKYQEFRQEYDKKIFYDAKSLVEMVSKYNAFIAPETFKEQKIDYEHKPVLSWMGAYNQNFFDDSKRSEKIRQNYSWSAGILVHNKYNPRVGFQARLYYTRTVAASEAQIIRINALSLDPSLLFVVYRNKEKVIWVGPYLLARFHFYSSVEQAGLPFNPRNIDGVSIGYYAYAFAEINRNWGAFIKYGSHKLPVSSIGSILVRGELTNQHLEIGTSLRIFR